MGEHYFEHGTNGWICYANDTRVPIEIQDILDCCGIYKTVLKIEEDNKEEWVALLE